MFMGTVFENVSGFLGFSIIVPSSVYLFMLLYPFAVVAASYFNLDNSATVLGSMAATYFVSVAAIVMAFFGANAYSAKGK